MNSPKSQCMIVCCSVLQCVAATCMQCVAVPVGSSALAAGRYEISEVSSSNRVVKTL